MSDHVFQFTNVADPCRDSRICARRVDPEICLRIARQTAIVAFQQRKIFFALLYDGTLISTWTAGNESSRKRFLISVRSRLVMRSRVTLRGVSSRRGTSWFAERKSLAWWQRQHR